ncbi:leucine--tRNA ligase [candidate division WWE3 bacterium CG10_big_fil_rev_8_21_14_0_10_32_10]|uniref:Leucine--tRNA ligase n=1 Tax=candidate division WWE3 bacterium CG10_big_fil_rev_8_21_14_0_10_32_10 TaxID=1975090 RepID=A0A2H0RBM5_UNCKA|nr:MAG: leucine--tRNA ligase [candidate division WWE3 bacterium CG10_big_fil_rev_8_21_14_0_10_32_10]
MMDETLKKYNPNNETYWVDVWENEKVFQNTLSNVESYTPDNKKYLLFAFAYPSGATFHVGHVEPQTALDILARFYRMSGYNIFFPVGWDAFGLPAENYAIKTGIPPKQTTKNSIEEFKRQDKRIAFSYDWSTEIATSNPDYYKWTQWIFLQLYKKGLAYKKLAPANWCPSCQTVLANEQVISGKCERCGTDVIQKELNQWFFKITKYVEELLSGLNSVDWPKPTKQQQINWIGKKEGINITYMLDGEEGTVTCFTTRPDTNFGASFIVIAPEHPLVKNLCDNKYNIDSKYVKDVNSYVQTSLKKTEEERKSEGKTKTGVFTGLYAINNLNNKKLPIWVSDFVLSGFGTGAVVGVPGHDKRDFQFAKTFDLPIIRVVSENGNVSEITSEDMVCENEGVMVNSEFLNGLDINTAINKMMGYLEEKSWGKRVTTYNLRDWLVSRQRYWGAPIPIVYDPKGKPHAVKEEHLPWLLPEDVDFNPKGESPLKSSKEFIERTEKLYGKGWIPEYDTMDTFVDSSWYYLRYADSRNDKEFVSKQKVNYVMPVDFYMIGPEHIVLHLLYSRFLTKFLRDEGYLNFDEPFVKMRHQGMILGSDHKKMSKSKGNVINPDTVVTKYGSDTLRTYVMFMGPIDADKPWNEGSVNGIYRFLNKVWDNSLMCINSKDTLTDSVLLSQLHKTIKKVTEDIPNLKYNTAISAIMQFVNVWEKSHLSKKDLENFLKILSPFAPFITEELYRTVLKNDVSIHLQNWPRYNESLIDNKNIVIPIQVNGKRRGEVSVSIDKVENKAYILDLAKKQVEKYLTSPIIKGIYVESKIINFVL